MNVVIILSLHYELLSYEYEYMLHSYYVLHVYTYTYTYTYCETISVSELRFRHRRERAPPGRSGRAAVPLRDASTVVVVRCGVWRVA